jgi:hypothetical protein
MAELAAQLRVDSIRASTAAGSGHPTSSMSAADLLAVLGTRHLRYDWDDPRAAGNDHLIFSKGHTSLLAAGVSNLDIAHLAVRNMPGSGSGVELLAWAALDADHIATAACRLAGKRAVSPG